MSVEYSASLISIPFAIILQTQKVRSGYMLTILSPEQGLMRLFSYRSKTPFLQSIQSLNLIDLVVKKPSSKNQAPLATELSLVFSFSPPYTEFSHFLGIQNLWIQNLNLLFAHIDQEVHKIFLLVLTFLQQSEKIQNPQLSYGMFISFFLKWITITGVHNDILYCSFCKSRLIRKVYTPISLFLWQNRLICGSCQKSQKLEYVEEIDASSQSQFHQLLYDPFQKIAHTFFQLSPLNFINNYLETFLVFSPKEALLKKNNPFIYL